MKNRNTYFSFLLSLLTIQGLNLQAQITRGAQPGEIYISSDWYLENKSILHYAILHSTNNGENISLQYENTENPNPDEMRIASVLGDATQGALYNFGYNELWISLDYGVNWEFVEDYPNSGKYTSGSVEGEIYKNGTDVSGTLYFSEDYGVSFIINNTDIKFRIEVGTQVGEIYGRSGFAGIGYDLKYSSDYGTNFLTIPIDSTVAFWSPGGQSPGISRGTESGEIYLTSWTPDYHYRIFHSSDSGYSWTQMFESDSINIFFWRVNFTAGRSPGSFYVMRSRINPAGTHTWLYIDYSDDHGETFTTYFHDLDSTITGYTKVNVEFFTSSCYPNPFWTHTTISFIVPEPGKSAFLTVYNHSGVKVKVMDISGKSRVKWDGTDNNGNMVARGVYFYNITNGKYKSKNKKLLIIN